MVAVVLPAQLTHIDGQHIVRPAAPIIEKAIVVDQGVEVTWLAAQAGTYPIGGYVVERNRDNQGFKQIARVEKIFLQHLDATGRADDIYRIIAEDNQKTQSAPSGHVTAHLAKPGSAVITDTLPATTKVTPSGDNGAQAEQLRSLIAQAFTDIDTALNRKDVSAADSAIDAIQLYQQQLLALWPKLSLAQKQAASEACSEHVVTVYTANMHALPEKSHMDGMLVLAGCTAIKESVT